MDYGNRYGLSSLHLFVAAGNLSAAAAEAALAEAEADQDHDQEGSDDREGDGQPPREAALAHAGVLVHRQVAVLEEPAVRVGVAH